MVKGKHRKGTEIIGQKERNGNRMERNERKGQEGKDRCRGEK